MPLCLIRRVAAWGHQASAFAGGGQRGGLAAAGLGVGEILHHKRPEPLPEIDSFALNPGSVHRFHSLPDLRPPTVTAIPPGADALDTVRGLLFLGPGPVSLIWLSAVRPADRQSRRHAGVVQPAGCRGCRRPTSPPPHTGASPYSSGGRGRSSSRATGRAKRCCSTTTYREIARVRAANGRSMDLHALTAHPRGYGAVHLLSGDRADGSLHDGRTREQSRPR